MDTTFHILAVDDEPDLRALLRILLESGGYRVSDAASGREAVERLRQDPGFDLVIMDIMMPGLDGVEAARAIRRFSHAPILFLTAKTQLGDKAAAYGSGGDDFLEKPFSQGELLLKVKSLLRRYTVYKGKDEGGQADEREITLDEERHRAVKHGKVVELTDKEFTILRYLIAHKGTPVDARAIYETVWDDRYLPSSNNTVMVHILNLRKKLEDDPSMPKLIRTVWGKGYQFG